MTKYSLGNLRMNKTILLAACFFSIFVTSGCRGTIMEPAPDNFVCTDPNSCAGNTYQTSEFQSVDPSADENEFVNYTIRRKNAPRPEHHAGRGRQQPVRIHSAEH